MRMTSRTLAATFGILAAMARGIAGLQAVDSAHHRDSIRVEVLPRNSWYPVPVLSKTQAAGLKAQVVLALLHRFSLDSVTRPSLLFVTVIATQKHQFAVAVGGDLWFQGNRRSINYIAQYQKASAPFYGIGPRTTDAAAELYDSRVWSGQVIAQHAIRPVVYAQVGLILVDHRVVERAENGLLAPDTIPGSHGFTETAAWLGFSHDSRTNTYFPRGGTFLQAQTIVNLSALGGSSDFTITTVDARRYLTVTPGAVFALQGVLQAASGTVPFQLLPALGGDALRAYEDGRWRDRVLGRAQLEWRQRLIGRFRCVAFAAAGAVAPTIGSLTDSPLRTSLGAGLRVLFTKKLEGYFRGDLARGGDGTTAFTFGWAEVF